ncbi:L-aspartate oxidase [Lysobacter olei]
MAAPIIVVGGGIAGLVTALAAAPAPVLLLTRSNGSHGAASALAQGGIAAALATGDCPDTHAHDTCVAGSHHNDAAMVGMLTEGAAEAVAWLQRQGVAFDRDAAGTLQFAREGGHDRPRVIHAGGDATGAVVMKALVAAARNASHIERHAGVEVDGLVLRGGRVGGVCVTRTDGTQSALEGRAVVLATGGIGGVFAHTSNPAEADGSGLALAMAAGAVMRDLEFMQFHPTALAIPDLHSLPLVTEALRGAGATLLDARDAPLMAGVHPLGDLAPRDIVARRVWTACQEGGAWLDARQIGDRFAQAFPTVLASCLAHGVDPRTQPIPVTPAAHFHMGGIAADAEGRTSLPGLFAVGEVACNGVHGANRLASNSLLEGVVFGRRLGGALRDAPETRDGGRSFKFLHRGPSLDAAQLARLRDLMTQAMGPVRTGALLQVALRDCDALARVGWQGALARALVGAALRRRQSLGAHFRDDGPLAGHSTKGAWRAA